MFGLVESLFICVTVETESGLVIDFGDQKMFFGFVLVDFVAREARYCAALRQFGAVCNHIG